VRRNLGWSSNVYIGTEERRERSAMPIENKKYIKLRDIGLFYSG
jgi:hypothetical protein